MISQMVKSPRQQGRLPESYDEKCERRHETRENLWRRNNLTTCRRVRKCQKKETEEQSQSPRQWEFLKRRKLVTEGEKKQMRSPTGATTMLGHECATGTPRGASSLGWMDPRSPTSLQLSWDNSTSVFHHKHLQHSLYDPHSLKNRHFCSVSSENIPPKDIPKTSRGTQTLTDSSTIKKDSSQQTDCGTAVLDKEIIQLSNYLKEALHRELLLKKKMVILQDLLSTLLQASEKSWKGQLNEEKLKGELRTLKNQLHTCSQSYSKDSVKRILMEMEDQKQTYEQKAREAVQKLLEEKLQAEQQLQITQRTLTVTEDNCTLWKEHYDTLKADWSETATKHNELENKLYVLQNKLQWADAQNDQLQQALQNLERERTDLYSRIEALQVDNKLKVEHVSAMEGKLQNEQKQKLVLEATITHLHNLLQNQAKEQRAWEEVLGRKDQVLTMQIQPPSPLREKQNALLKHPDDEGEENLMDQMQKTTAQLSAKEKECVELRSELEALSDEYHSCMTKLRQCREELNHFQSKQAKRQCGHWIPLLMVVIAAATAAFLANFVP